MVAIFEVYPIFKGLPW